MDTICRDSSLDPSAWVIRIGQALSCQPSFVANSGLMTKAEAQLSMSARVNIALSKWTSLVRRGSWWGVIAFSEVSW